MHRKSCILSAYMIKLNTYVNNLKNIFQNGGNKDGIFK